MSEAAVKSDAKWYIVHTYSNFEKKVAEAIREQARNQGLEDRFEEIVVPTEEVVEGAGAATPRRRTYGTKLR